MEPLHWPSRYNETATTPYSVCGRAVEGWQLAPEKDQVTCEGCINALAAETADALRNDDGESVTLWGHLNKGLKAR